MLTFVLEAALRSFLMALAVWASIRLLRVQAVIAQKVAWVMVLLAAGAMPLVMRSPVLTMKSAIRVPALGVESGRLRSWLKEHLTPANVVADVVTVSAAGPAHLSVYAPPSEPMAKPSAAHRVIAPEMTVNISRDDTAFTVENISAPVIPTAAKVSPAAVASTWSRNWSNWNAARVRLWLVSAYAAIVGLLLLRALAGLSVAFRLWGRATPVTDFAADGFQHVRVSPDLTTPVTIGSTILLPADYREWDEPKLRVVLAHEGSHVQQGDFYLQILAALHVAVFWFSPLGWWLQRKLSELGEALSDRAGLEQASSAASYAQILLEFAAAPRTNRFDPPLAGVAMARRSNLSGRIERILNDRRFRLEFLGGRRHAFLSALLVPAALVAVVACIRFVPAVEAAEGPDAARIAAQSAPRATAQASTIAASAAYPAAYSAAYPVADQAAAQDSATPAPQAPPAPPSAADAPAPMAPIAPNAPAIAPTPPVAPDAAPVPEPVPEPEDAVAPRAPRPPRSPRSYTYRHISHDGDDGDSFAIIHGNDNTVTMSGDHNQELAKVRQKYHGDFIWFERDGKSYVITDPTILAQSEDMFKMDPRLKQMQESLDAQQKVLNKRMAEMNTQAALAQLETPEYKASMARLEKQLAELNGDQMKKLTAEIAQHAKEYEKLANDAALAGTADRLEKLDKLREFQGDQMEKLGELQGQIGEIHGQIGELQGQLGEKRGEWGEKQGELGEKMGELGEQMGKIGEEQGRKAEEASRKMKSVFDQAIRDGKAKPVE